MKKHEDKKKNAHILKEQICQFLPLNSGYI